MHACHGESIFDDDVGLLEAGLHVAAGEQIVNEAISRTIQRRRKSFIAGYVGMDDRRAFLHGRNRIKDRRQLLVFDCE